MARGGGTLAQERRVRRSAPPPLKLSDTLLEVHAARRSATQGRRVSFYDWALRVPEPKHGTLDFDRFPYQRELYKEGADDRELVISKSTQVGASSWAVRWLLNACDTRGDTGLYVLPVKQDVYDFGSARVKPMIEASEYLRQRGAADVDRLGLRRVGLGLAYFRASQPKRELDTVDADHLVLDEYDTLDHANIPDAERRLSGPLSRGLMRRLGVPSVDGWGIDALYQASDQRRWTVKCDACGEWQDIDFFRNVDMVRAIRICHRCARPLDVRAGEWVAEYPDRDVRGYHMHRLIAPDANLKSIIAASKKRTPMERQVFFNKDLGLPWAPEEGRLSDAALAAAQSAGGGYVMQPGYVGQSLVTMGVDVASARALNVRVSQHLDDGRKRALLIAEVQSFDDLALLMDRYDVRMAAIDHLPEGRLARSFAERFAGRVYIVAFATNSTSPDVLKVDEEQRFASVKRLEAIDATLELVRSQRNQLPLDWPDDYPAQMKAAQRIAEEDAVGRKVVRYVLRGDADYLMAEVYDLVATELWHVRQAVIERTTPGFTSLDEHLEFERASLADYDAEQGYAEGPMDADYFGPGDF